MNYRDMPPELGLQLVPVAQEAPAANPYEPVIARNAYLAYFADEDKEFDPWAFPSKAFRDRLQ